MLISFEWPLQVYLKNEWLWVKFTSMLKPSFRTTNRLAVVGKIPSDTIWVWTPFFKSSLEQGTSPERDPIGLLTPIRQNLSISGDFTSFGRCKEISRGQSNRKRPGSANESHTPPKRPTVEDLNNVDYEEIYKTIFKVKLLKITYSNEYLATLAIGTTPSQLVRESAINYADAISGTSSLPCCQFPNGLSNQLRKRVSR